MSSRSSYDPKEIIPDKSTNRNPSQLEITESDRIQIFLNDFNESRNHPENIYAEIEGYRFTIFVNRWDTYSIRGSYGDWDISHRKTFESQEEAAECLMDLLDERGVI